MNIKLMKVKDENGFDKFTIYKDGYYVSSYSTEAMAISHFDMCVEFNRQPNEPVVIKEVNI